MSHELRTPLNAILGMTETLLEEIFGPLTTQQSKALQTVEQSGNHLLSLINDILDLSKMEAGQMTLTLAPTSIPALCDQSLVLIRPQAQKKNIDLQVEVPPDLPLFSLDQRRCGQALINLLQNAVKFTSAQGTVQLSVRYRPPVAPDQPGQLYFAVQDTGIGIAPENIGKLFQLFVQIDSSLSRSYEGTGLGLVLVKRIVELHGGQVGVTSEVGVGSCFWFELPGQAIKKAP
jgi:signal transduction histidine kinase